MSSPRGGTFDPGAPWRTFLDADAGRVALAWSLAGGVTAGGLLVAAVTWSGNLSSSLAASTCSILFVLGALAGFAHGGVLGYLSRDLARPRSDPLLAVGVAALLLLLAAPVAWIAALLVALSPASLTSGRLDLQLVAAGGWAVALLLCGWGAWEGWDAFRTAFGRWPERRLGTLLVLGVLAVLGLTFFLDRPVIWGTDLQVKGVGAVVLALGATLWIAFPVVLASLHLLHRLVGPPAAEPRPLRPPSRT